MSEKPSITELGNPAKPQGEEGALMLTRMNDSHAPVTEWGLGFAEISGNFNILDIGCGAGGAVYRLSRRLTDGHITGIDHSEVSAELSRKNNAEGIASGKVDVMAASVDSLPFGDDTFDLAYTVESFYFWGDHVRCLKEVRRVLKKGGRLLIIADIYGDAELSAESMESVRKYDLFNPTLAEFRELLTAAGFGEVNVHTKEGTTWVCAEGINTNIQ